MLNATQLFSILLAASLVSAHGWVTHVIIDGVDQPGVCVPFSPNPQKASECIGPIPGNDGPTQDYTSTGMRCGKSVTTNSGGLYAQGKAGSTVQMQWSDLKQGDHFGPMDTYMSACPNNDCTNYVGDGDWFKISERASVDGMWGSEWASAHDRTSPFTIPPVPEGKYLIRQQWIALHGASSPNGAQFYPSCFNIEIKGGTTGDAKGLTPTGKIPGMFNANDPGILINIWNVDLPGGTNAVSTIYKDPGVKLCAVCGGDASDTSNASGSGGSSSSAALTLQNKQAVTSDSPNTASNYDTAANKVVTTAATTQAAVTTQAAATTAAPATNTGSSQSGSCGSAWTACNAAWKPGSQYDCQKQFVDCQAKSVKSKRSPARLA